MTPAKQGQVGLRPPKPLLDRPNGGLSPPHATEFVVQVAMAGGSIGMLLGKRNEETRKPSSGFAVR